MSWMLFSIFLATLLVIKGRYRKTDSCPSGIVQWRRREGVFKCQPETPYHCILMYNSSQLYETCIAAVTIGPGKEGCPWIMFHQDIPLHGSRNSECPVTNPECPSINHKGYLSNQLYQYPACFFESSKRTTQLKPSTVAENKVQETTKERNVIIWIIVPTIAILLIVLVVIVFLRRKKVICSSDQESGRTKIEGPGDCNGSAESLQLIPTTTAPDNSKSRNQQSQVEGPGKRDEEPDIIGKNEDLTSTDDKNVTDTQREEVYNEDLAHRVFRDILDTSDGVVSYHNLLMHFIKKKDCSKLALNLEHIIKTNGHMFRYLADQSICFVIAYSPNAVICDNYNPLSLAGECVDPSCSKFHICTFHAKGSCRNPHCTLSHTYGDEHNMKVKERLRLSNYTDNDISKILLNRYPKICCTSGCDKEVNCPYLHICSKFCFGKCSYGLKCRIGHSFRTEHNTWILKAYGISVDDIWSGSPIARKLKIGERIKNDKNL